MLELWRIEVGYGGLEGVRENDDWLYRSKRVVEDFRGVGRWVSQSDARLGGDTFRSVSGHQYSFYSNMHHRTRPYPFLGVEKEYKKTFIKNHQPASRVVCFMAVRPH